MAFDNEGVLFASCRADDKILKFDAEGIWIVFADIEFQKKILARPEGEIRVRRTDSTSSRISTDNAAQNLFLEVYTEDGLDGSTIMAFIIFPPACTEDFDEDGDVDGRDLAVLAAGYGTSYGENDLSAFAEEFGRTDCPE
jgi:hypothetical protein